MSLDEHVWGWGEGGLTGEDFTNATQKREGGGGKKICLKIKKGEGSQPAVGAGGAESRGARCALQPLPRFGLLWGLRGGRGRGALRGAGAEAAELRSGRAGCPRSGLWGKSPPARSRPAGPRCTSFRKRRRDRALQGSYPFSRSPPSAPRAQPSLRDRRGKTGSTRLGSAVAPHFNRRSLGPLTAAEGRPTAVRAPALRPESARELRGPPVTSRQPNGRSARGSDSDSACLGLAKPARVNVNFANQAVP